MQTQDLATTLVSTQELMGNVAQEPQLRFDGAVLGRINEHYFRNLRTQAPQLISQATVSEIKSLHRIGVACRLCGDFELAKLFYVKAVEMSNQAHGADSLQTSTHRNFLAGLYFAMQQYESARRLIEYSLSVYQKQLGDRHIHTGLAQFALALVYAKLGEHQQAKKCFDASGLKKLQLGEAQSVDRWQNLNFRLFTMAAMKFEQQQYDESYELFRYCVISEAHEAWPGSMVVAKALHSLAQLCRAQQLNSEAEEFFKMTLKMKEDIIGREHADYLQTQGQYRDLLKYMGKTAT